MRESQASKIAEHHKVAMQDMLVLYKSTEKRLENDLTKYILRQRQATFKAIKNVRDQIEKLEDPEFYRKMRKQKFELKSKPSDLLIKKPKAKKSKNQMKITVPDSGIRNKPKRAANKIPVLTLRIISPHARVAKKKKKKKKKR